MPNPGPSPSGWAVLNPPSDNLAPGTNNPATDSTVVALDTLTTSVAGIRQRVRCDLEQPANGFSGLC